MPVGFSGGVPGSSSPGVVVRSLRNVAPVFHERNYTISGVTKDSSGSALSNCTVLLFNTTTNTLEQTSVSDASGNYSFVVDKTRTWYAVSYKAGSPDVAGTTVNTLAGA